MFDIETVPAEIARLMQRLQEWTIEDVARRITENNGEFTQTAAYQLTQIAEIRVFEEDLRKEIQKILSLSSREIAILYEKALISNEIFDKRVFEKNGIPFKPYKENIFMQNLTANIAAQTKNEFTNITRSLGFVEKVNGKITFKPIAEFYQKELDLSVMKVITGVETLSGAVKSVVEKMGNSGLRTVDYASGRSMRIDAAARLAIFNGLKELTNRQSEYNAIQLGTVFFEMTWHSGHRPSHGWGGRRFSERQTNEIDEQTDKPFLTEDELYEKYGGGTLDDYNCYHRKFPIMPYSAPQYSDSKLYEMEDKEKDVDYFEGKPYNAYEARQEQRKFERSMLVRRSKNAGYKGISDALTEKYKNETDKDKKAVIKTELDKAKKDLTNSKSKYTQQRRKYEAFSKEMGIRTEYQRVYRGAV